MAGPLHSLGGMRIRRCPYVAAAARNSAGFSLLELLTVVAIIGTMAAVSVPTLLGAIAHAKLRGASSSLAGLIQSGRMQAVKRNRTLTLHFVRQGGVPFAFAKDATDPSTSPGTDLQVQLGGSAFQVAVPTGAQAAALTSTVLSYTPLNYPDLPSFNPRGLPCKYVSGVCTPAGFVYYMTDTSHAHAWTAVSISPGGRIKQWLWDGRTWMD